MVGEQKDARIAELEAQLKQSQHNAEHHAARAQRAESLHRSKSEALDNANGKLLHQKKCLDRLESDLADFGEANLSLKNKLRFRDQVIDSQKRTIREWHQAYTRVSKKLEALQAENEDISKWSQKARQVHANVCDRLDCLETKIIESKKQQNAVLELKDRRIADLERELNTCRANYSRLLWLED